ncbi:unnamed protein product [Prunus armeniaca]|uniref:Uncharacterized protein n=1 Tax=Prunus armeniaca TaxID=36596 RepID=A0A6J5USD4_PRUAR|nr:unnamed protein product [Prunus armeniaca]
MNAPKRNCDEIVVLVALKYLCAVVCSLMVRTRSQGQELVPFDPEIEKTFQELYRINQRAFATDIESDIESMAANTKPLKEYSPPTIL